MRVRPGRRSRSRLVNTVGATVVGLICAGVIALGAMTATAGPSRPVEGGDGRAVVAVTAPPSTTAAPAVPATPAPSPTPPPSLIATLTGPTEYYPAPGGPTSGHLDADNPFGARQVLAVVSRRGAWLEVELPIRPNGSTAWIAAASATLTQTPYAVTVSLAARTLTVTYAGRPVLSSPVTVGAPATPTPPDHTYLWELIRPDNQKGAYGPYIFGLAEFSDAYRFFNGGDAQIGLHGNDEPWAIGTAASHGCVRLPNDVIAHLATMLPLGTPVTIG